jgi:hypothetical protein
MSRSEPTADIMFFIAGHSLFAGTMQRQNTWSPAWQSMCPPTHRIVRRPDYDNPMHQVIDIMTTERKTSMAPSCPQTLYATSTREFSIHG